MIEQVTSGQKFAFAAEDFNLMARAVNDWAGSGSADNFGCRSPFGHRGAAAEKIYAHVSGQALTYGKAVHITGLSAGAKISDPTLPAGGFVCEADTEFTGEDPMEPFAIATAPGGSGEYVPVCVSGICAAPVTVNDDSDTHVKVTGSGALTTAESGYGTILYLGDGWALIALGGGGATTPNKEEDEVYELDRTQSADDGYMWDPYGEQGDPSVLENYRSVKLIINSPRFSPDGKLEFIKQELVWAAVNAPVIKTVTPTASSTKCEE